MEIPSIKFRYFTRLKLWHDYLSKKSVFETEKSEFWKYEKMILHWAYSNKHKHLYTALTNKRILQIFGINKEGNAETPKNEIQDINSEENIPNLIKDFEENKGRVNYYMGNLVVEGLFVCIGVVEKGGDELYPKRIRINEKGLLIGEILNEAYNKPRFFRKNFRKYKIGYWLLILFIIITLLSIFLTLLNQIIELIGKFVC